MEAKSWIVLGAFFGATAVIAGALHAHGLSKILDTRINNYSIEQVHSQLKIDSTENLLSDKEYQKKLLAKRMEQFGTGVLYQFYHILPLLIIGLLIARKPMRSLNVAGALFTIGTILFSGCLYLLAFTGAGTLGHLVMCGGICQIAGWLTLMFAGWRWQAQG